MCVMTRGFVKDRTSDLLPTSNSSFPYEYIFLQFKQTQLQLQCRRDRGHLVGAEARRIESILHAILIVHQGLATVSAVLAKYPR